MKQTRGDILGLAIGPEGIKFAEKCNFDAVKIWNTCPRSNWLALWLLKSGQLNREQAIKLCIVFAEHALPVYKAYYPDDLVPLTAIEAAKTWLANPTEENSQNAGMAAIKSHETYAKKVVSDFVSAAAAYGYAAASVGASRSVTYAAYAVYICTVRDVNQQWQADKIRELIPCPFD